MEERWQKMSIFEQMGNIYSELSRAESWEKRNDIEAKINSLDRALELINFTLSDKRFKNRLKEVARLKELVADHYLGGRVYGIPLAEINSCLLPFAIKARELN